MGGRGRWVAGQEVETQECPTNAGCPLAFLSVKGHLHPVQVRNGHPAPGALRPPLPHP